MVREESLHANDDGVNAAHNIVLGRELQQWGASSRPVATAVAVGVRVFPRRRWRRRLSGLTFSATSRPDIPITRPTHVPAAAIITGTCRNNTLGHSTLATLGHGADGYLGTADGAASAARHTYSLTVK